MVLRTHLGYLQQITFQKLPYKFVQTSLIQFIPTSLQLLNFFSICSSTVTLHQEKCFMLPAIFFFYLPHITLTLTFILTLTRSSSYPLPPSSPVRSPSKPHSLAPYQSYPNRLLTLHSCLPPPQTAPLPPYCIRNNLHR